MSYDFWTFDNSASPTGQVELTIQIGPVLNYLFGKCFLFAISLDDQSPQVINPIPPLVPATHPDDQEAPPNPGPGTHPADWVEVTTTEIRNATASLPIRGSGKHTLTIWGLTSGIVFERVWIDFGGIKQRGYSYLGPSESSQV